MHISGPVRLALLGCGRIARRFHLPVLSSLADAEVVAIADTDVQALSAAHTCTPRATAHRDWREAIAGAKIDAAVICLPSPLHHDSALGALSAGLHVYLEKPIATNLSDAESIVRGWKTSGTVGQIGFNFRFHPSAEKARAMILSRKLGAIVGVSAVVAHETAMEGWRLVNRAGGGALADLAVHHIDLARFLTGDEFSRVSAGCQTHQSGRETVELIGHTSQGIMVSTVASNAATRLDQLIVLGEKSSLVFDRYTGSLRVTHMSCSRNWRADRILAELATLKSAVSGALTALYPFPDPSYRRAIASFLRCVKHGRRDGPTLDDGLAAERIVEAARRSIKHGHTVDLLETVNH